MNLVAETYAADTALAPPFTGLKARLWQVVLPYVGSSRESIAHSYHCHPSAPCGCRTWYPFSC